MGEQEVLLRRLRAVEDELAIMRRLADCAHAVDYGDEAASLDGFTDDATWIGRFMSSGATFINCSGRAELAAFFRGHTRAPEPFHKHVVGNIRVEVRDDIATSSSYVVFMVSGQEAEPVHGGFGRYTDELRLCPDGQWRIASRLAEVEAWSPVAEAILAAHGRHRPPLD